MTTEQFRKLVKEFQAREAGLLNWKRSDYAGDDDCLKNFHQLAEFLRAKPEEVCQVYLLKHLQAIQNALETGKVNWDWETKEGEGLKQRIADARNYLLLLAACIEDSQELRIEPRYTLPAGGDLNDGRMVTKA